MKNLIIALLRGCYSIAVRIVPQAPRRILFISDPDYADNSWHLYQYMVQNCPQYHLQWLTRANRKGMRGVWKVLRAKYIFFTHDTYKFVVRNRRQVLFNLWHGMPIKKLGHLKDRVQAYEIPAMDYTIATSQFFAEIMAKVFAIESSRVLKVGLPRNDILRKHQPLNDTTLSWLPSKNMIAWLPTFRQNRVSHTSDASINSFLDEWSQDNLDQLEQQLQAKDTCLVVKLHPRDILNDEFASEQSSVFIRPHIVLFTAEQWQQNQFDLYQFLAGTRGLVTDVSSVLIDYLISAKPVGITQQSEQHYQRGSIAEVQAALSEATSEDGPIYPLNNVADWTLFIEHCLSSPKVSQHDKLYQLNSQPAAELICEFLGIQSKQ